MSSSDDNPRQPAATGPQATVDYAVDAKGSQPARTFVEDELTSDQQVKMASLFQWLADHGRINNREKFKKLEGSENIYEFKHHQIRIGCFQVARYWYLTHGFIKKQDRWPPGEIARAERIRSEHLAQKAKVKAKLRSV